MQAGSLDILIIYRFLLSDHACSAVDCPGKDFIFRSLLVVYCIVLGWVQIFQFVMGWTDTH